MDIFKIAQKNQDTAWQVVKEIDVFNAWRSIGAEINMVGSLKSGLLMKNRDIDFHIYTDELLISDSFSAIKKIAENNAIKDITYKNLIDTEEECIEWHAWYQDRENFLWQIDMIHIRKGSAYDGVVESMTNSIIDRLTDETKEAILRIKYDTPEEVKILGAEIYHAVLFYGVKDYKEFSEWKKNNRNINLLELYMKRD